ncbi:hypothetical protein ABZS98_35410 [Streptomyces avermitilis]|uniref:hypothetical protein n=1 Tax=Streptomyces avermitilis TaxID=33903 RepID=UPI0033B9B6AF
MHEWSTIDRSCHLPRTQLQHVALRQPCLTTLRAEDDLRPASVPGIVRFVEEILSEDGRDVADILEQLETTALRQAHDAHGVPGAQSAPTTDV